MRIGIISDLHIDRYNNSVENIHLYEGALAEEIRNRQIDMLLIAGDISNSYELTMDFIHTILKERGVIIKFVPSNHVLWHSYKSKSTQEI